MRTLRSGKSVVRAMLLLPFLLGAENATSQAVGTIHPPQDAPDFVKEQWKDVVANGQFPMPKRDWKEVGLPPGLEEQVWNAWAPGAKRLWRNISPGYVNVTYDAKVDNGVISILLDGGGIVQSKDGGRSWREIDGRNRPQTGDLESVSGQMVEGRIHIVHGNDRDNRVFPQ